MTPSVNRSESGFTLLEVVIASGVFSVMFLGMGAMLTIGAKLTDTVRMESLLVSKAQELLDACRNMPFGQLEDEVPDTGQINEAFNNDPQLGTATLHGLMNTSTNNVITFPTSSTAVFPDGFPIKGEFTIRFEQMGAEVLASAVDVRPDFESMLITEDLLDETIIRLTVTFRKEGENIQRLLLRTFTVTQSIPNE